MLVIHLPEHGKHLHKNDLKIYNSNKYNKLKMNHIFRKLPLDVIKYIFLYDEHFIMRKGEIISIIPKTDYRYNLLNFITFNCSEIYLQNNELRYKYYFPNLYNYEGRQMNNSDLIQVNIHENHNFIINILFGLGNNIQNLSIVIKNKIIILKIHAIIIGFIQNFHT